MRVGSNNEVERLNAEVRSFRKAFYDDEHSAISVSLDAPLSNYYPWAIVLRNPPAGVPEFCEVAYANDESLPVSYACGSPIVQYVPDVDSFFTESATIASFRHPSTVIAFDLDRSGDTWTVRVAGAGSSEYKEIDIAKAFF